MKKVFLIGLLSLVVSSCGIMGERGEVGIAAGQISKDSNENKVWVNRNSFMTTADTYEVALGHCQKFGKTPKLTREAEATDFWMKDEFDCVTN
jgi:hypothetical protein